MWDRRRLGHALERCDRINVATRDYRENRTDRQLTEFVGKAGRNSAERWVGHPAVRSAVLAERLSARRLIFPLVHYIPTADHLRRILGSILDFTGIEGDEVWTNAVHVMGPDDQLLASFIFPMFAGKLWRLLSELSRSGVPLDPKSVANAYLVGQMLLQDVDFTDDPRVIVETLGALPEGFFTVDGRSLTTDEFIHSDTERALTQLKAAFRKKIGVARRPRPYPSGRTTGEARARQLGAAAVLDSFPDATAKDLLNPNHAARQLYRKNIPGRVPSLSTLRRDLIRARSARAE